MSGHKNKQTRLYYLKNILKLLKRLYVKEYYDLEINQSQTTRFFAKFHNPKKWEDDIYKKCNDKMTFTEL